MKGLLIKDFILLKKAITNTLVIAIILTGYCLFRGLSIGVVIIPTLLCAAIATSSLKLDWSTRWDKIVLTMPVNRNNLVFSKYVELLILATSGLLIGIVLVVFKSFFNPDISIGTSIVIGIVCFAMGLISGSIHMLLAYKFGGDNLENSEILLLAAYGIGGAVIAGIVFIRKLLDIGVEHTWLLAFFCVVIALLVFFVAYKGSSLLYSNKELQ